MSVSMSMSMSMPLVGVATGNETPSSPVSEEENADDLEEDTMSMSMSMSMSMGRESPGSISPVIPTNPPSGGDSRFAPCGNESSSLTVSFMFEVDTAIGKGGNYTVELREALYNALSADFSLCGGRRLNLRYMQEEGMTLGNIAITPSEGKNRLGTSTKEYSCHAHDLF